MTASQRLHDTAMEGLNRAKRRMDEYVPAFTQYERIQLMFMMSQLAMLDALYQQGVERHTPQAPRGPSYSHADDMAGKPS